MIIPIIMCGGSGTRLWPASRDERPKQFIPLFSDKSTFQATLERLMVPELFDEPIIITNERFHNFVADQANSLGVAYDIVLEPIARDSAAAVAVAAYQAERRTQSATALVLAADHSVTDVCAFHQTCRDALDIANKGYIVTFGIEPEHPATGYGYLQPGDALGDSKGKTLSAFVEKPDKATARAYLEKGYLWNSGNFMFQTNVMIDELNNHAKEIGQAAMAAIDDGVINERVLRLSQDKFAQAPKTSIDYAVMEKTDRAAVIPANFGWSDIGSWDAVWQLSEKDSDGNVTVGDAESLETTNSIIHSEDGITTAVSGLDNIVVVATKDSVLVTTREKAETVKVLWQKIEDR